MKKYTLSDVFVAVIWLLPAIYAAVVYSGLPATIAVHFNADGKADGFGPRVELFGILGATMGASALVYFLMKYLPAIDPKKYAKYGEDNFRKLSFGMVGFLSLLSLIIVNAAVNGGLKFDNLVQVVISLLLIFIGNMMYNIKPNYFVGIRTPWTLESEENWRATHRLASKLWVGGGILLTVLMLLLHGQTGSSVFTGFVIALAVIPMAYSYRYFRQHQQHHQ